MSAKKAIDSLGIFQETDGADKGEKSKIISRVEKIINEIKENDGYEFDYLSQDELIDGYTKLTHIKENDNSNMSELVFSVDKDQELLDRILQQAFNEEYNLLSNEQKRDFKQLAFEMLEMSLIEGFEGYKDYVRNPIVIDAVEARNSAVNNGYKFNFVVNNDSKDVVKNLGKILHVEHNLEDVNFQGDLLDNILKKAIGENYESMEKSTKRDYMQYAYEFLPDDIKETCINPIESEKMQENENLGIGDR